MVCQFCGQETAVEQEQPQVYRQPNGEYLLIDRVPVIRCRSCGHAYVSGSTARMLATMRRQPARYAEFRPVRVAVFGSERTAADAA